jgi:hypothetical protein
VGAQVADRQPALLRFPFVLELLPGSGCAYQRDGSCSNNGCSVLCLLDCLGSKIRSGSKLSWLPRPGIGLDPERVGKVMEFDRDMVAGLDYSHGPGPGPDHLRICPTDGHIHAGQQILGVL